MNLIQRVVFNPLRNSVDFLVKGATETKRIQLGLTTVPYVGTDPEVGGASPFQLTARHARWQVLNPAGNITARLPANVQAGEVVRLENRSSTNLLTIQTSSGQSVDAITNGFIELIALVNNPTNSADWRVRWVVEQVSKSVVFNTGAFTGGNAISSTWILQRQGRVITAQIPNTLGTANVATNHMTTGAQPLAGYQPTVQKRWPIMTAEDGTLKAGELTVLNDGTVAVFLIGAPEGGANWAANGTANDGFTSTSVTWTLD